MGAALTGISENISDIEDQNRKIMKHLRTGEKQRKYNHKEMLSVLKEDQMDVNAEDDQDFIIGQVDVTHDILIIISS